MTDKAQKKPPRLPKVTDRQAEILEFIHDGIEAHWQNQSPFLRAIAIHFGITVPPTWDHVEKIKAKGLLGGEPGAQGSLFVTDTGKQVVDRWKSRANTSGNAG